MLPGARIVACALLVIGCGNGSGGGADAGPTGPCSGTYAMAWPSNDDPQFCMLPWDEARPPLTLTECGVVFENCSSAGPTPDLSCVDDGAETPPADPSTVTLTGFADVFSSGPNSDRARVQVFRESDLAGVDDIATVTPLAEHDVRLDETSLVEARACPKSVDFMQGQCVVPTNDCGGQCDKALGAGTFCWEGSCEDLQRWEVRYAIPNVPTNEFLVVRTVGLDASGNIQVKGNTWSPLFQYNVYLSTADDACQAETQTDCIDTTVTPPLYRSDINLLSSQDYQTIPTSAGLSSGITPGNGAIAGEIHDCKSDRIQHAQIAFTRGRQPRVLVYFNGNPVKTLPQLTRSEQGTNKLGLYAGLDIAPGPIELAAVGVSDGAVREVGRFNARIWPDSTTLVRIGGGRPPQ